MCKDLELFIILFWLTSNPTFEIFQDRIENISQNTTLFIWRGWFRENTFDIFYSFILIENNKIQE